MTAHPHTASTCPRPSAERVCKHRTSRPRSDTFPHPPYPTSGTYAAHPRRTASPPAKSTGTPTQSPRNALGQPIHLISPSPIIRRLPTQHSLHTPQRQLRVRMIINPLHKPLIRTALRIHMTELHRDITRSHTPRREPRRRVMPQRMK